MSAIGSIVEEKREAAYEAGKLDRRARRFMSSAYEPDYEEDYMDGWNDEAAEELEQEQLIRTH